MEEHQDKHVIGGIMSLVSGACGVLGMVTIIFVLLFIRYTLNKSPMPDTSGLPFGTVTLFVTIIYGIVGLGLLVPRGVRNCGWGICPKEKALGLGVSRGYRRYNNLLSLRGGRRHFHRYGSA